MTARKIVNVGLIGCGEVTQVIHLPTLSNMSDWFRITYLCDVSDQALEFCNSKLHGTAKTTRDAKELCSARDVDVVMVINSDEYHSSHAVLALEHGKHVFVEKPIALTKRDALAIADAEKKSKGKVMVGYMRRYAAPFEEAIQLIGGMDKILYARVRDIIGPNSVFVGQSATFPRKFTDFTAADSDDKNRRAADMVQTALQEECGGVPVTPESSRMWRVFGGLGSHDLSVMREALGMPEKVVGSSLGFPFWNVLFKYPTFTVSYESGFVNIPRFDAHLEVYSADKSVRVQYDTPYVKGLPTTLHISENDNGEYKETTIRKTYEDAYTSELKTLWGMVEEDKQPKTTVQDAMLDLDVFAMAMKHGYGVA